jgi:hypothetical protein
MSKHTCQLHCKTNNDRGIDKNYTNERTRPDSPPLLQRAGPQRNHKDMLNLHQDYPTLCSESVDIMSCFVTTLSTIFHSIHIMLFKGPFHSSLH